MSNIDRAADVIAGCWPNGRAVRKDDARELARALDAAGPLAPEPPAPDRDGRWWPTAASVGNVGITQAGEVAMRSGKIRDMALFMSPDKARNLGRILLAAAEHAEEVGTDEA